MSELETRIKKLAGPSAFPDDGKITESQKTVIKPDITEWPGLDIMHRVVRQLGEL